MDIGLLAEEGYDETQMAFSAAAANLRSAAPDDRDEAKRKYIEAAAAVGLGVKRPRRG